MGRINKRNYECELMKMDGVKI